jgi:hypothetical protein
MLAVAALALLLLATLGTAGCRRVKLADVPGSDAGARDQTQTVQLGGATSLGATVHMAVGELKLAASEPSSTLALDGSFTYPAPSWKPKVTYAVEGTRGVLVVSQPEESKVPAFGNNDNIWDLKLAQGIPTDLTLNLGVGQSTIDLSKLDVTRLKVVSGVGQTTIDLSGPLAHDLLARVDSGVGEVDITVPANVPVKITGGSDGIGEMSAPGFKNEGDSLVNDAWGSPGPTLELELTRGIGEIKVTTAK